MLLSNISKDLRKLMKSYFISCFIQTIYQQRLEIAAAAAAAAAAGQLFVFIANDCIEPGALTQFCYCENCFTQRGIRILMEDHCFHVPVAAACKIKRLVSHFKGQSGNSHVLPRERK